MRKKEGYKKLYNALREYQGKGDQFTFSEIATRIGLKEASLHVYERHIRNLYMFRIDDDLFEAKNLDTIGEDDFIHHMTQKKEKDAISFEGGLLKRSRDSFLTAIELYNRPTQGSRAEIFCILIINAWELFLKRLIYLREGENGIYEKDGKKSITFAKSVSKCFKDNDPVRFNLEKMEELRNGAAHLIIPELNFDISRLFQSCIFNYIELSRKNNISLQIPTPGLITLTMDNSGMNQIVINENSGKNKEMASHFQKSLAELENRLNTNDFMLAKDYRIVLTKNQKDSDISISLTKDGTQGIIIEKPKDSELTHPYRTNYMIEKIKDKAGIDFNRNDFLAVAEHEGYKKEKNTVFHYYHEFTKTHQYSEKCLNKIVKKINENSDYLEDCRKEYKNRKKR